MEAAGGAASAASASASSPYHQHNFPVESLQQRLATGLGNKGGARGSLTRCVGRLSGLKRALDEANAPKTGAEETDHATDDDDKKKKDSKKSLSVKEAAGLLSRDIQLARTDLTKLFLMAQRQEEELEDLADGGGSSASNQDLEAEREAVQKLRLELQRAQSTVAAKAEYEQTAKLLCAQHPTPAATLQAEIQALQEAHRHAQAEYQACQEQYHVRQSQFQLLLQCLLDLKQSLTEPLKEGEDANNHDQTTGKDAVMEEAAETTTNKKPRVAVEKKGGASRMRGNDDEEDGEEEEGALYDDL